MIDRYIDVRFRCECLKILLFGIHERWNTNEETYFGISYLSISCLEMLETSVLGLGQDLCLISALGGAMTTSTYFSHIVFDLNRASLRGQFLSLPKMLTKILDFLYSAITLVSGVRELSLRDGLVCLER